MLRLLIVILAMCTFAYVAQIDIRVSRIFFYIVVAIYGIYVGLRTGYNDTWNYIHSFERAVSLQEFLADPERMNIFHNPLFYGFNAWFHGVTDNYHIYFMIVAIFNAFLLIRFIERNSFGHFAYSIFLFWGFGVGMFGAAAMKQITAMALLTLAYEALSKHKWICFIVLVVVASLIHTYAILFLVMPFFISRPWNWRTMLLVLGTGLVLFAFNPFFSSLLDYAEDLGKSVSSSEVFDGISMNIFRVFVYAIPPALLFFFRKRLVPLMNEKLYILSNMSIISFMFILMGRVNGANMFGRLATYFVFGNICILGWIIEQLFNEKSRRFLYQLSIVLFIVFIWYDNRTIDAYGGYTCISLMEFIKEIV